MNKLFLIILPIYLLTIVSCNEETTVVPISTEIRITFPNNNSNVKELDSILIKVEANLQSTLNKVEIFGIYSDLYPDTLRIAEFNQLPYEKYFYLEQICVETDTLVLYAKATFNSDEVITSNSVNIFVGKIIPPDDSLEIYDYQGFDMDSNLVAEGSFSFYLKDAHIYGRKNISAVLLDSAFEYGNGFIDGYKFNSQYDEYQIQMNVCYMLYANGELFIYLSGNMDGDNFTGDRYLGSFGPEFIKIGTFRAIKRE
jgi:hypothetical protein